MIQGLPSGGFEKCFPCSDRRRTAGRSDAHPQGRNKVENLNEAKRREGCADVLACDDGSERE
jgi:hypothetical protein